MKQLFGAWNTEEQVGTFFVGAAESEQGAWELCAEHYGQFWSDVDSAFADSYHVEPLIVATDKILGIENAVSSDVGAALPSDEDIESEAMRLKGVNGKFIPYHPANFIDGARWMRSQISGNDR